MKIILSPTRSDEQLEASVSGDVLTLNGVEFDFSELGLGESISSADLGTSWIVEDVVRELDGEVVVILRMPHGAEAPEITRFPDSVTVMSGDVPLPPYEEVQPAD